MWWWWAIWALCVLGLVGVVWWAEETRTLPPQGTTPGVGGDNKTQLLLWRPEDEAAQVASAQRFAPWLLPAVRWSDRPRPERFVALPAGQRLDAPLYPEDVWGPTGRPRYDRTNTWGRPSLQRQSVWPLTRSIVDDLERSGDDPWAVVRRAQARLELRPQPLRLVANTSDPLLSPPPKQHNEGLTILLAAHPDDEVLFGAVDLLTAAAVHVIFLTYASDPVRRAEGDRVIRALGASVSWYDLPTGRDRTWTEEELQPLAHSPVLLPSSIRRVVSHDARGEYGHPQHRQAHAVAQRWAAEWGVPCHTFLERWRPLTPEEDQERTRLLGFYRSQGIEHWVRFWERYTKEVR